MLKLLLLLTLAATSPPKASDPAKGETLPQTVSSAPASVAPSPAFVRSPGEGQALPPLVPGAPADLLDGSSPSPAQPFS